MEPSEWSRITIRCGRDGPDGLLAELKHYALPCRRLGLLVHIGLHGSKAPASRSISRVPNGESE
jgi:hypothetical protein